MSEDPSISLDDISALVTKRLKVYENLNPLEEFAMLMGKMQLLELRLQQLLANAYDMPFESTKNWTLGHIKNVLKESGVRPDFIQYLEHVVDYRNYFAHEFLANTMITLSIANFSERKVFGDLYKAGYEVEQLNVLADFCDEHDAWE